MKIYNKLKLVLYRTQLKKCYKDAPKSIFETAVFSKKRKPFVNNSSKSVFETAVFTKNDNYSEERNARIEKSNQKIKRLEDKINRLK